MTSFAPSTYSYGCADYGDGAVDLTPRLGRISASQVTSGDTMVRFIETVKRSVQDERGPLDSGTLAGVVKISSEAAEISDPTLLGTYFDQLRSGAVSVGAPKTAAAITDAARWFSSNVGPTGGGDGGEEPFYKKPWFPFAVAGGAVAIGIVTYALWPSKPKA